MNKSTQRHFHTLRIATLFAPFISEGLPFYRRDICRQGVQLMRKAQLDIGNVKFFAIKYSAEYNFLIPCDELLLDEYSN